MHAGELKYLHRVETPASIIGALLSHGLPGVIIALLAVWLYMKDRELKLERDARIADAKNYTEMALKLQQQAIDAVNKLSDVFEELKKIMAEQQQRRPGGPRSV